MAEKQFYVYKGTSIEGVDTSKFETNALITKKQFADNIQENYAWTPGEDYQQNQFIYEYELDNIDETEKPNINNYIEIVGGQADYVQTKTYNNSEQSCEFKIKMKGDTVLHKNEDYRITSSSDSFDVTSDTDPTSPYYETITMYGTDAKSYYVTIEGINNYQGSIMLEFIINKKSLSEATITQNNELVFSGGINDELNPEFKIQFDDDWYFIVATNTTSNNFDVTFNKTTGHGYAGEHTNEITIKAKNNSNYTGSVQVSYFVNSAIPSISFVENNTQIYDEFQPRYFKVNNLTVAGYLYYKIFDVETSHEIDITDESTYDDNPYIATGDNVSISNAYRINVGTYYIVATFVPNNSSSSFSDTPSYETVTGLEGTLTIKNEGDLLIVFTSDTNNYVYNDEPKTPNFRVECNGVTISSDNYTYSYDNNTNAGTATLTVTGKNNYNGKTANATFTIKKATPTLIVNDVNTEFDFNMHYLSVVPSVDGILKFNRINSSSNNIYTQGCTANNTQYLSQIQEFNNTVETYGGSLRINLEFTPNNTNYNTITTEGSINITPRNINQTVLIWLYDDDWNEYTGATYVYDGYEKQPNVKIYISDIGNNGKTIELRSGSMIVTPATQDRGIIYRSNGVSYEVIYENNINANNNSTDPSVTVDISGNMYANPITTTFVINKADSYLEIGFGISHNDVSNELSEEYNPNVAYKTFCNVYDSDNYYVQGTIYYKISTTEIANPTKNMLTNSSQYTETGQNTGYVWLDSTTEYKNVGNYYLYAYFESGNDNYKDTEPISANLMIGKVYIDDYTVNLEWDIREYNGNEQKPEVTSVRYGNQTLTAGTDYDIEYPNDSTNAGTKTITITGNGNYDGETTAEYEIEPADLNLEIGFGTSINDVSTYPSVVYDSNNVYYTFCSVYDDDNYAIKGTIHYKITTEEIENITEDTKDMLTNSSQYTETGKNPGYILLEGNTIKYTDAGEYYLYAYFEPTSDNYNNTNIIDANLIIEKADPDIQVTVKDDLIYNTKYQELISVSNPHNLNILYLSSDNEITEFNQGTPFSANIPSYKDVCTKYVYYKFNGNDNYEAIEPTLAGICTISPYELRQDNTAIQGGNYTYTGNSIEPAYFINVTEFASGSNPWLISSGSDYYIVGLDGNSPVRTDAGTYQVRIKGRNNYSGDFTVPFIINKATPSAISMEDQTKYYDNTTKTFTITNNNNVAGTITYTVDKTIIDIDGNETNGGRVESSEQISANSSIDINIYSYVGVYNINSVTFTPSDTTNYNVYNKSGSNNLTIEPDVTDIWISNMPASSFDPGTALTGGFTITQGQSLQLYVVGRESGWYNGNGVDSRYEEIDEEITVTGDTTICTINNNELYGVNIGSSTLHVTYRNDNGVTKSHTSNVTVTSAVVGLAAYIKNDNEIYAAPTSSTRTENQTILFKPSHEIEDGQYPDGIIPVTALEINPESFEIVIYEILQTTNGGYELGNNITGETSYEGSQTSGGCSADYFTFDWENTDSTWKFSNFGLINYDKNIKGDTFDFDIDYGDLSTTITLTANIQS